MEQELQKIKNKYGEQMMHLCRNLFPTILEKPNLLYDTLCAHFDYNKQLYNDIVKNKLVDEFRNYIYDLIDYKQEKASTDKTPKELLSEAGYDLYECKTPEDILRFKEYYVRGEEICTFYTDRLVNNYVFFAVKKDVDKIKREDFPFPERQDRYGTSVISIQFSKGPKNVLKITNRYNHKVENPDATFSNNLDNIIPGLTTSFEKYYGLNTNKKLDEELKIPGYVKTNALKYYKYNSCSFNTYFCDNNIIIHDLEEDDRYKEKEKYLFMDSYILDLQNKKLITYNKAIARDFFTFGMIDIDKIDIYKENAKKVVILKNNGKEDIVIELDNKNRIITYINNNVSFIGRNFMYNNTTLRYLEMRDVEMIGPNALYYNTDLETLIMPSLRETDSGFLANNNTMRTLELPNLEKFGFGAFFNNISIEEVYAPKIIKMSDHVFFSNPRVLLHLENQKYYNNECMKLSLKY